MQNSRSIFKTYNVLLIIPIIICLITLVSWVTDSWDTFNFNKDYVPMPPSNSIAFLLICILILIHQIIIKNRTYKLIALITCGLLFIFSLSVAISPWKHLFTPIEVMLYDKKEIVIQYPVGRMALTSGFNISILSLILMIRLGFAFNKRFIHNFVLFLATITGVFGLWIFVSYLIGVPQLYYRKQIPMSVFTSLTVSLISIILILKHSKYTIINRIFGLHRVDNSTKKEIYFVRSMFIFGILALAIGVGGVLYLRYQISDKKEKAKEQLELIADMKTKQLSTWYIDNVNLHTLLFRSEQFTQQFNHHYANNSLDVLHKRYEAIYRDLEHKYNYDNFKLFDSEGKLLYSYKEGQVNSKHDEEFLKKVVKYSKVTLDDFHVEDNSNAIHLDFWIPIPSKDDETKPIAYWLFHYNPTFFLYPYIQEWPTNSKTAETLLVKEKDSKVIFLNDLRHVDNSDLHLSFLIDEKKLLPAVIGLRQGEGVVIGPDYREVLVLAALRAVKGTDWFMVSKIDLSEVYEPIKEEAIRLGSLVSVMLLFVAFGIGYTQRRRELQSSLALSKEWKSTFDSVNDIIWILDQECKILRSNSTVEQYFSVTTEEVIGRHCWEIVHKTDKPIDECPIDKLKSKNGRASEDLKIGDKWFNVLLDPIYDEDGEISRIIHLMRDITDQKIATMVLKGRDERLRSIINSAPFGAHTWELNEKDDLILIGCNKSADQILKIDNKALLGKTILEAFPGNAETGLVEVYKKVALSGEPYTSEHISYNDGLITGVFDVHAMQIQPRKITVFFRDITDKRKQEQEIKLLNESLEQKVQARTKELQIALKELESFSYSVSHDLRAPLRGIDGMSQILLEDYSDILDDNGKDYLGRIKIETKKLEDLIEAILTLSRTTRLTTKMESINLSKIANSICSTLKGMNPDSKVIFKIIDNASVYADKKLMEVVLTNLLSNAVKYTSHEENPVIEFGVRTNPESGDKEFYVSDNGVGFDLSYKDKLFKPFERLHSYKEFKGTGIGLTTVKKIIERHSGRIWADSVVNKFATFYFTLGRYDENKKDTIS